MITLRTIKTALLGTAVGVGLGMIATAAYAGGFAIREQSASSQGASFAGNAANTDLSAMYWNPAGAANRAGPGINTESHYSIIFPRADVTVDSVAGFPAPFPGGFAGSAASTEIAGPAIVPASYMNYQVSKNLFLGMSTNSGFGLVTKPDNPFYAGSPLARTSKLFTMNGAPTLAYVISPGVVIGVGAQIQYADGTFKFATGTPGAPTSYFNGDDFAFGATAGIMLTPSAGTRIGLGWRSALTHELEGKFASPALPGITSAKAEVNLPDIVTFSVQQAIAPNMRLLGTVEWSNWSRFKELRVTNGPTVTLAGAGGAPVVIDASWSDGWFFSGGLEYDHSPALTLRGGVAYEISPIDDPKKRIIGIPDSDRIWLSVGASYKWSKDTTLDFAYTHIFLDDAKFDRNTLVGTNIKGSIDASTDIISASVKTKLCIFGGC